MGWEEGQCACGVCLCEASKQGQCVWGTCRHSVTSPKCAPATLDTCKQISRTLVQSFLHKHTFVHPPSSTHPTPLHPHLHTQSITGIASAVFSTVRDAGVNVIMISQASSEHSICFAVKASEGDLAVKVLKKRFADSIAAGR